MGNSVRSSLGNPCGAEASKDLPADEDQRPVARPKEKEKSPKTEKKKKEKKLKKKAKKKNKKNGVNGDASLGKIDEEEARENVDETTLDDTRLGADSTVADGPSPQVTSTIEQADGSRSPDYERRLMSPDKNVEQDPNSPDNNKTLLEQSIEAAQIPGSPETMMFVIDDQQPQQITSTPTGPGRPGELSANKSPISQVIVEEEEHNTLDFGKYVLVDPNTGDIAVMRNRSRSLDSLVSIQSNRSSISKFGSFELVTDFEINIAEKNQQSRN